MRIGIDNLNLDLILEAELNLELEVILEPLDVIFLMVELKLLHWHYTEPDPQKSANMQGILAKKICENYGHF